MGQHPILRRAWSTPRGNTFAGALLLVAALATFPLVRLADGALSSTAWASGLIFVLAFLLIPALVITGLGLLFRPARHGIRQAAAGAAVVYVGVGGGLAMAGIPGYIDPGALYLLPAWPSYVFWLHECALGAGLWPCPPG